MTGATRLHPEQALADKLVARLDLRPPVDVGALLSQFCDVVQDDFLGNADAVMYGLLEESKPLLLLNPQKSEQRIRFTLAHELAHLLIPWHVGTIECHPLSNDYDGTNQPAEESSSSSRGYRSLEDEADRFASRILVPRRFLDTLRGLSVREACVELESTNVSATAAMRAYSDSLSPGYALLVVSDNDTVISWHMAPQTVSPGFRRGVVVDPAWLSTAVDRGRATYRNRSVIWMRSVTSLDESVSVPWRTLLDELLDGQQLRPPAREALWKTINGVAASANSASATSDPSAVAAAILNAAARRPELVQVVADPRFKQFAIARAMSFAGFAKPN
ncbi:MAG: ImmA/IrrE family metallo-endopeptidase [Nocardioidaceae bacterium]|nr:ImmA/IrrE family metallo-endopeptidase [Nocardioidaceae bacterium]